MLMGEYVIKCVSLYHHLIEIQDNDFEDMIFGQHPQTLNNTTQYSEIDMDGRGINKSHSYSGAAGFEIPWRDEMTTEAKVHCIVPLLCCWRVVVRLAKKRKWQNAAASLINEIRVSLCSSGVAIKPLSRPQRESWTFQFWPWPRRDETRLWREISVNREHPDLPVLLAGWAACFILLCLHLSAITTSSTGLYCTAAQLLGLDLNGVRWRMAIRGWMTRVLFVGVSVWATDHLLLGFIPLARVWFTWNRSQFSFSAAVLDTKTRFYSFFNMRAARDNHQWGRHAM